MIDLLNMVDLFLGNGWFKVMDFKTFLLDESFELTTITHKRAMKFALASFGNLDASCGLGKVVGRRGKQ